MGDRARAGPRAPPPPQGPPPRSGLGSLHPTCGCGGCGGDAAQRTGPGPRAHPAAAGPGDALATRMVAAAIGARAGRVCPMSRRAQRCRARCGWRKGPPARLAEASACHRPAQVLPALLPCDAPPGRWAVGALAFARSGNSGAHRKAAPAPSPPRQRGTGYWLQALFMHSGVWGESSRRCGECGRGLGMGERLCGQGGRSRAGQGRRACWVKRHGRRRGQIRG